MQRPAPSTVPAASSPVDQIRAELASEWWTIVLRGGVAIAFGLVAFFWSTALLGVLALLFGAYALIDGLLAAWAAVRIGRLGRRWWPMALEGAAGIVIGLIAIISPTVAALTLVAFIGAWAILTGIAEIAAAARLRREIRNEWLLSIAGALSILFGLFAIASPAVSAIAIIWVVGVYAILFGCTLIALGLKLRGSGPSAGAAHRAPTTPRPGKEDDVFLIEASRGHAA